MKKIVTLLLVFSILSCEKQNNHKDLVFEKLKSQNDSLRKELKKAKFKGNYWFDTEYEGLKFTNKGIKNPEEYIKNSLREKAELIPLKATLGGIMKFENIQILGDEWLIADYSDGHVDGRSIYSYKFNKNKTLEFKIMISSEMK